MRRGSASALEKKLFDMIDKVNMDKKRREGIPSKNYLLFIQKENKSIDCFLCYKLIGNCETGQ